MTMKLNLQANGVKNEGAAPSTENQDNKPSVVDGVPVGATKDNPNAEGADSKSVEKPAFDPRVAGVDVERITVKMPERGARFRIAKSQKVMGELDSLKDVQKWVHDNHCDPTHIEVLTDEGKWINFDRIKV